MFDHNASLCQDYATCTFPGGRRVFRNAGGVGTGNKSPVPVRKVKGLEGGGEVRDVRLSVMKTRVALGKGKRGATKTKGV